MRWKQMDATAEFLIEIEDFPNQIIKLINSKKIGEKLTENAFKFVQDYDWKEIVKKYIELYDKELFSKRCTLSPLRFPLSSEP